MQHFPKLLKGIKNLDTSTPIAVSWLEQPQIVSVKHILAQGIFCIVFDFAIEK